MNIPLTNTTIDVPLVPLGATKKVIKKLKQFQEAAKDADPELMLDVATDCLVLVTGKTQDEIEALPIGVNDAPAIIAGVSEACGLVFTEAAQGENPAAKQTGTQSTAG